MTKKALSVHALPEAVSRSLRELGGRIRAARLRRRMSQADLAAAMYVSRKTLYSLEAGDPGIGMGIFATALFTLGLHRQLNDLVTPQSDVAGLWHAEQQLPRTAHRRKREVDKLDF